MIVSDVADTYVIVVGGVAICLISLVVCMSHHVVILATMRSLVDVISCCFRARALYVSVFVYVVAWFACKAY